MVLLHKFQRLLFSSDYFAIKITDNLMFFWPCIMKSVTQQAVTAVIPGGLNIAYSFSIRLTRGLYWHATLKKFHLLDISCVKIIVLGNMTYLPWRCSENLRTANLVGRPRQITLSLWNISILPVLIRDLLFHSFVFFLAIVLFFQV